MPLDSACIAPRRLSLIGGGAARVVAMAGSVSRTALPYDEVVRLLQNWSRWAATWRPPLGVQPPPWADGWIPSKDFELWGDGEAPPPPERAPDIDEIAADMIDKRVMQLAPRHVLVLKHRYIDEPRRHEPRDKIDAAIRALGDILGR